MNKKNDDELNFSGLFKDAKPIQQAKYLDFKHKNKVNKSSDRLLRAQLDLAKEQRTLKQSQASVALSDSYEAHWPQNKAIQYLADAKAREGDGLSKDSLKKLKMGFYPPDIEIDLHGLNAKQAKEELIAVIHEAKKRHLPCINFIHGHGNGVLKRKLPNWLVQHPDVGGFIQSPKAFGGSAGLLVLVGHDFSKLK